MYILCRHRVTWSPDIEINLLTKVDNSRSKEEVLLVLYSKQNLEIKIKTLLRTSDFILQLFIFLISSYIFLSMVHSRQ